MGRLVPLIFTSLEPQEDGGDGRYLAFIHRPLALILKMKNNKHLLERITEQEAEQFVKDDLARYCNFGEDVRCMLMFNKTRNLYYRGKNDDYYIKIGSMQNGRKEE